MNPPPHSGHPIGWLLACVILVPLAAWLAGDMGEIRALDEIEGLGSSRADLYRILLERELERPGIVPLVLAQAPLVLDSLAGKTEAVEPLNQRLEELVAAAELSDLYVMNAQGVTIAASNARSDHSFVGKHFAFRQYFVEAMAGGIGHEFALGTTSLVPGYYVAQPVSENGRITGAVIAKVDLARLEKLWSDNPERLLLASPDGKVMLADSPTLRFQPMPDINENGALRLGSKDYLVRSFDLQGGRWHAAILLPTAPAKARRLSWATVGAAVTLILLLAAHVAVERRRNARTFAEYDREQRAMLEQDLKDRTAELVQAAKLATIGSMAAGVVHEINQPLSAIGSFAGNAQRFMELGRLDRVGQNLAEISAQVERLASITRRLKGFARRPDEALAPIQVAPAVERVIALIGPRLREQGVSLELDCGPDGLTVMAEQVRLEQILVNLISNALDAMKRQDDGSLSIRVRHTGTKVIMTVADTGPGIAEDLMARLFDPFTTTKPTGEGLGLGLSIASAIVRDFGGTLSAANRREGGAIFTLELAEAT